VEILEYYSRFCPLGHSSKPSWLISATNYTLSALSRHTAFSTDLGIDKSSQAAHK
jgi:hypothetical protein